MNKIIKYAIGLLITLFVDSVQARLSFADATSGIEINTTGTLFVNSGNRMDHITGILKLASPENVTGGKLFLDDCVYTDGNFEIKISATYDPSGTYTILLNGDGSRFNMQTPGKMSEKIEVRGIGNTIESYPIFRNSSAINVKSQLTASIAGELNSNIVLDGRDLLLGSNLSLFDDIKITGSGTINFQGYNLSTGQKDLVWTDTLTLIEAQNLELGGKSLVRGQWKFQNDAHIVGNNYTLDVANGGEIRIRRNTTLRMSNLILAGLGSGKIIFEDYTAALELYNVVIDMDDNYTFTDGTISAQGPVTIITRDKHMQFTLVNLTRLPELTSIIVAAGLRANMYANPSPSIVAFCSILSFLSVETTRLRSSVISPSTT